MVKHRKLKRVTEVRLLPRVPWEQPDEPDDPTYHRAYTQGQLTQEEVEFVEYMYSENWFDHTKQHIRAWFPMINEFARNHPNTAGALNRLVQGLTGWVIPRIGQITRQEMLQLQADLDPYDPNARRRW
jgi:hypothetical protein